MKTSSSRPGLLLALGFALGVAAGSPRAQVPATQALDPAATLMPPAGGIQPGPRWTLAQLQASFALADSNGDGQLTRAESQQLRILPASFEDLDADKDGVLSADEYQAGVR